MKARVFVSIIALWGIIACSTLESGIQPSDFDRVYTVTERSGGCALFLPGTVDAIAPAYEVKILESNSDFIN